jgi:hypothetical protein
LKYNIFVSYPVEEQEIVENLRTHFNLLGVKAWIYSLDRTLAHDVWTEIKDRISDSDLVIFVVSQCTLNAEGQHRELEYALQKVNSASGESKIMPIFINGTDISACPLQLRNKNGIFLDEHTVKSVALQVTKRVFPALMKRENERPWKYPVPGEWLVVSNLDGMIERYFDMGDKLYFRSLSPMGLLECYSPKIKGLFWIAPEDVRLSDDIENDKKLEEEIPRIFKISGMIDIQRLGWKSWNESQPT